MDSDTFHLNSAINDANHRETEPCSIMNKESKFKAKLVTKLQSQIDTLKFQLEKSNQELKDLKEVPDTVIELLKDRLKPADSVPAKPVVRKEKKTLSSRLSADKTQSLKDGLLGALRKHDDWMKAADLKAAFNKLPNAGDRYNTIVTQLKSEKMIVSKGERTKTEYKLK